MPLQEPSTRASSHRSHGHRRAPADVSHGDRGYPSRVTSPLKNADSRMLARRAPRPRPGGPPSAPRGRILAFVTCPHNTGSSTVARNQSRGLTVPDKHRQGERIVGDAVPPGVRLGIVRSISYGLFAKPDTFVPQLRELGASTSTGRRSSPSPASTPSTPWTRSSTSSTAPRRSGSPPAPARGGRPSRRRTSCPPRRPKTRTPTTGSCTAW
jgi:hypothetical protein